MTLHNRILYPALIVEQKVQKYSVFDVVFAQSDFLTLSRLPAREKYVLGSVFSADGQVFEYKGSSGWPRFGEASKRILEILIIPSLLAKVLSFFFYYGPRITSARKLDLSSFAKEAMERLSKHVTVKDMEDLKVAMSKASTFEQVIRAVDWWRYHGGKRDEDGHPLE